MDHDEDIKLNPKVSARIRNYFLAGVLVTAPISITIYLTYSFFSMIDSKVRRIVPFEKLVPPEYQDIALPGIGIIVAIIFFIIVGWFARNFMGKLVIRISEYIVHRLPVISSLYGAIKQILETVMASKSQAFREVVMLEYPRKGVWSIGFVTGVTQGQIQDNTKQETMNVFVPTTPNPTSGYLLFVPKKELKYLDMTVEQGVKLVVSAGIINPEEYSKQK